MVKGVELTPRKKCVVVALKNEGFSSRHIAKRIGFHYSTVARFIKRHTQTGSIDRVKGRGRKKASSSAADRVLMRLSIRDRKASSSELN